MEGTPELRITAQGDREILITRVFNAPRALVFEGYTKPELLRRWLLGPPGWEMVICEVDLRVGGAYRYGWRHTDGREMGMHGVYREIVPPGRIQCTELMAGNPSESLVTTDLTDQGGKTRLVTVARYESQTLRDAVLRSGMERGVRASYDRLEAMLQGGSKPPGEDAKLVGLAMVLTKDELIRAMQAEVRILLHLISKVDAAKLGYRPTPRQRSTLELLQYLSIFAPIHLRTIAAGVLKMDAWSAAWQTEEAAAAAKDLEALKAAIADHSALIQELIGPLPDSDLRAEMEVFGSRATRGVWLVRLVLCHYAAYRMQLFLYLKASGREELNTLNLWAGIDAA